MVLEKIVIAVNDFRLPFVDDNRKEIGCMHYQLWTACKTDGKVVSNRWTDLGTKIVCIT